ncbi:hypothetical protein ACFE04_016369 [Oxalis oulophora]
MSQFTVSQPSWPISPEQHVTHSLSNKPKSLPQLYHDAKLLGLKIPDRESSSTQSIGQSQQESGVMGGTDSRRQSTISSPSGEQLVVYSPVRSDESFGRDAGGQFKPVPVLMLSNPDIVLNPPQIDHSQAMARANYPYADPYYGGIYSAYGPQTAVQPLMVGISPVRVPLPLELSEDGPIYVNAKQYHGILRRRQSRAKLEAQNKLVKARKPYLHESRHLHALNRVRGVGGRFLSKKELQQLDSASANSPRCISGSNATRDFENLGSGLSGFSFQQADDRFSGFSLHMGGSMQNNGGLMCSGKQHNAPVVR